MGRISALSLVIPFGLGLACGFLIPAALLPHHTDRRMFALLLAVALSVSAIPVIAKTLSDMRLMHRDLGQLILATATVDDAVAWFGLSVVSAMAVTGVTGAKFAVSALYLGGFLVAAIAIGRPLVRMAATRTARFSEPAAALTVVAFLVILLGGAITDALGFEAVFGAFIAGTLLTAADVSRIVLARLRTVVMAVLAPIFLASAGLRMDVTTLRHPAAIVTTIALLAMAVIGKFAGGYAGGRLSRLGVHESMALGSGLNSRGVVQIVIAMAGLRLGLFSITVYTILLVVAVGTSIMTAPMLRFSMKHIAEQDHEQRRRIELSPEDQLEAATVSSRPRPRPDDSRARRAGQSPGRQIAMADILMTHRIPESLTPLGEWLAEVADRVTLITDQHAFPTYQETFPDVYAVPGYSANNAVEVLLQRGLPAAPDHHADPFHRRRHPALCAGTGPVRHQRAALSAGRGLARQVRDETPGERPCSGPVPRGAPRRRRRAGLRAERRLPGGREAAHGVCLSRRNGRRGRRSADPPGGWLGRR